MRTYYWYLTAYLRKHGLILMLSLLFAVGFFSLFIPAIVTRIENKHTKYIGVVGEYRLNALPDSVQHQLSYGLTNIEENGSVIPELSERWSVENEGKTYRFVLKKNIVWQDGKSLEPSDIQYNFRDVEVVTTPNDIIFKLPDPFAPFPTVVSQPVLREVLQPYWVFFRRPMIIGMGSYRMTDYKTKGQRLTQVTVESSSERLIYRFYLTEDDAILGFKRGEVDMVSDLSDPGDLATWDTVTITKTLHTDRFLAVFFNNQHPSFTKNVRQALSYAVAKSTGPERAIGPINPQSWAFFPGSKTYAFDLPRAVERLLSEVPQQPLHLKLTTTAAFADEAELIKTQWETLGTQAEAACQTEKNISDKSQCANLKISVTVLVNNYPDTNDFEALLIGHVSPPDPDQYYLWHSGQSTNFTHYQNTRIDSLLEKGRQTQDQKERLATYQEFQQFLLEDAPALFLRHLESYDIKRK